MIFTLEPEAAYICCKHLLVKELEGTNLVSDFQSGSKYLVLDAGGQCEMAKTFKEENENQWFKEIKHRASRNLT